MDSIHDEILTAVTSMKQHGKISFDLPKLLSLPLLSSVFTETLRLRMSTTPTRQLRTDLEVDGYLLKAGNCVMLPSWLAHTDTKWSTEEHPATSFWAERFLQSDHGGGGSATSSQPKPGSYFPFGGGSSMCPGRFFAKQEILTAVAIMILKFDIHYMKFVHHNGRTSDRGPEAEVNGAGGGALFPDRDIMVRLRRKS
jgi:cytochrome P450